MKKHQYVAILVIMLAAVFVSAQMRPAPGMGPGGTGQQQPGIGQPTFPGQAGQQPNVGNDQTTRTDQDQDRDRDRDRDKDRNKAKVDDQSLERQVHEQLATRAEFSHVTVHVKKGIAELTGPVARKEDRKEAVRLAKSVPGVRSVKEKLKINASAAASTGTTTTAGAAGTAQTSGSNVTSAPAASGIGTAAGTSTSSGSGVGAPSSAGSMGQTQPQSGSVTTAPSQSSSGASVTVTSSADAQVQQQIQSAIQSNKALVSSNAVSNVMVNVNNNSVILSGAVPDQQSAQQLLSIAQAHANGRAVVNNLTIGSASSANTGATTSGGVSGTTAGTAGASTTPSSGTSSNIGSSAGSQGAATSGMTTTTADTSNLGGQIKNALASEPTLANDNINVNVTDTSIELSGSVATGKEKQTARRIAQSYAGNRRVVDRITVTGRGQGANINKGTEGTGAMGTSSGMPSSGTSSGIGTGTSSGAGTSGMGSSGTNPNPR